MLSRKKIIFIFAIGSVLLAVLAFIILPTAKKIKFLSQEIDNQYFYLENLYVKGQVLKVIKKDFETYGPQIEEFSNVFIKKNKELEFITALERTAEKENIDQNLVLEEARASIDTDSGIEILPLQLSLFGDFKNNLEYLTALESLDFYVNLKSINISKVGINSYFSPPSPQGDSNNTNFFIRGSAYRE